METRPEGFFIAEHPALDLLNTRAAPWGDEIEWLADAEDLFAWLEKTGLMPGEVARRFRREALPGELEAVTRQARELREWFRGFIAEHFGQSRDARRLAAALTPLNRLLARDDQYRQIAPGESRSSRRAQPVWRRERRWRSAESLLLPLAEAMGELICAADPDRVRRCAGEDCTLWFLDTSKSGARRWCSMAVCGNRAKQASHRARHRDE